MLRTHNSLSWYRADIEKNPTHFFRDLSDNEKAVIADYLGKLDRTKSYSSTDTDEIDATLAVLKPLYDEIVHALVHERGFIILQGLPTAKDDYTHQQVKKFFLEFSKCLGKPLIQNKNQDLIFDVKSIEGLTMSQANSRGPYVKESLPMHTDAGAILGMYCYAAADIGGDSLLASARVVHDEIKKMRSDLLETLYQPYYVDRRNNEPVGALTYDISPVFAMYGDDLMCQYHQPFYTDAHTKCPELPPMTEQQKEALALFDKISLRDDIVFKTKLSEGCIIFINNEKILHGRATFDYPQNQSARHLMRIWLVTKAIQNTFPSFLGYPLPSVL